MSAFHWLYPIRAGQTALDAWSLAHLGFWVFIGSTLWAFKLRDNRAVCFCLLVASLWEVIERYLERAYPSIWIHSETPINSFMDIVICYVGVIGIWKLLDKTST